MEKMEVVKTAIVLDTTERSKLIACLEYCLHRIREHPGNGLSRAGVDAKYVEYMRKNI